MAGGCIVRDAREAGRAARTKEGGAEKDLVDAGFGEHLAIALVRVGELDVARP